MKDSYHRKERLADAKKTKQQQQIQIKQIDNGETYERDWLRQSNEPIITESEYVRPKQSAGNACWKGSLKISFAISLQKEKEKYKIKITKKV